MAFDTTQPLWRTAFDEQYTRDMLRELVKQTTALTKRYERYTPRKSTDSAEDRVHTAMMKLFDGSRTWDPTRVDLSGFLLGVVASDLTSELRRARQVPHVSLDDRKPKCKDDYTGEQCDESRADSRASIENGYTVPIAPDAKDASWFIAMTNLRKQAAAAGDARVLALLGAYDEGVFQKRDVIALLNWTSATYKRVYERLLVLADEMDPSVREAISYGLTN